MDIQANPSSAGALEFADLTEAQHRRYLQSFFALESLKRTLGDLTPQIEPSLLVLRSYTCGDEKP